MLRMARSMLSHLVKGIVEEKSDEEGTLVRDRARCAIGGLRGTARCSGYCDSLGRHGHFATTHSDASRHHTRRHRDADTGNRSTVTDGSREPVEQRRYSGGAECLSAPLGRRNHPLDI